MQEVGNFLVSLPRQARRGFAAMADAILLAGSVLLAVFGRLGPAGWMEPGYLQLAAAAAILGVLVFWAIGLYREILQYAGPRIWLRIACAVSLVAILLAAFSIFLGPRSVSRTVLIGFLPLALVSCGGARLLAIHLLSGLRASGSDFGRPTPMIIYGAGASGVGLAAAMRHSPLYRPVAFVDDDSRLHGSRMRDLTVHAASDLSTLRTRFPDAILVLAIPSASTADRRRVIDTLRPLGIRIMTVPGLRELMVGEAAFGQLREVKIEDLLGRDSVKPNEHLLARCVTGRSVLVTGAGGSIGSELCRQIVRLRPARLVLLEHSEFALYQIEQELAALSGSDPEIARVPIHAVLGSVTSGVMVEELLRNQKIQTIYHAAAYKHVGIVETNEVAGVLTNAFGTQTIAHAALKARVETFVLISTDKAVRPSNVMGASKRLAELILQDLSGGGWTAVAGENRPGAAPSCPTRFVIVRFGNVLGSSGSVVPKFLKQIAQGGPVTVTHPEVTRYFMTISEAVNLVIQAGSLGFGGDILILDMGQPVRIVDLARNLICLQGLSVRDASRPDGDIAIEFIGLEPAEKLNEILVCGNQLETTEHPKISRALEPGISGERLRQRLAQIESACDRHEPLAVRAVLMELVREESPFPPGPLTGGRPTDTLG